MISSKHFLQVSVSKAVAPEIHSASEPEAHYNLVNTEVDAMVGWDCGVLKHVRCIFNVGQNSQCE